LPVAIRRAAIRNFKSIAACSVQLGGLTFLVGPNGAGKSNFLDALRFVSDSVNTTVEQALRDRGGIGQVRRHSRGHPNHFGIRLDLELPDGSLAWFAFEVGARRDGGFLVKHEQCRVERLGQGTVEYRVRAGELLSSTFPVTAALDEERLALVALASEPALKPVYESLRWMGFYNLNPVAMAALQDPDPGHMLLRDGRNLASVVRELKRRDGGAGLEVVCEHLRSVVPGIVSVAYREVGPKETIEFRQEVAGDLHPLRFLAGSMSDGTLRALGVLVAALQTPHATRRRLSVVGIEEPEIALHPGAAEVVTEALLFASARVQIITTTHSPDLLEHKRIDASHLLAVSNEGGSSLIGPVDEVTRSSLRDRLFSAGELLRQGQIEPEVNQATEQADQLDLFAPGMAVR